MRGEKVFLIQHHIWCNREHLQQQDGAFGTALNSNAVPMPIVMKEYVTKLTVMCL